MQEIYLDNAATTPMSAGVVKVMTGEMEHDFGNASSTHAIGRQARQTVERARKLIADSINADPDGIIFTSGGSESNNTALMEVARSRQQVGKRIITTKIEHPSILNPLKRLAQEGFDIVYLDVDQSGHISLDQLKKALTPETILVSIMAVNNEVGSIMPLAEIGKLVRPTQAYFHVDAVQGLGNIDLDVQAMQIDLLSTSAHKINGPKFLGFLYENPNLSLPSFVLGGEQEHKRRAGTENVPAIAGFGEAVRELGEIDKTALQAKYQKFQTLILSQLKKAQIEFDVNGSLTGPVSHHVLNLSFPGISTYVLLTRLDLAGFAVSGGSACTAGSLTPSHVLAAMYGADSPRLGDSIRISFGRFTTQAEVAAFAQALSKLVAELQSK
ncbi:MAG: cysteine desulfurase [Lactobacillus sp.]|jgi:cysteine desulfurase|nr:cysteine desulfurase [Lactobacillus sp.]